MRVGISQPTLTKLIHDGKLRPIKIGRTRMIEKPADAWRRRMARDVQ
jgi:excisionase family DNA binding protein